MLFVFNEQLGNANEPNESATLFPVVNAAGYLGSQCPATLAHNLSYLCNGMMFSGLSWPVLMTDIDKHRGSANGCDTAPARNPTTLIMRS